MIKYKRTNWKLGTGRKESECCLCGGKITRKSNVYIPANAQKARTGERLCVECGNSFAVIGLESISEIQDGGHIGRRVTYTPGVAGGRSWGRKLDASIE